MSTVSRMQPPVSGAGRTIHALESLVSRLDPIAKRRFDDMFAVDAQSCQSGKTVRRVTRVFNRWLGEATSIDESRQRRSPATVEVEELQQRCVHEANCAFCDSAARDDLCRQFSAEQFGDCLVFAPRALFGRHHRLFFPKEHNPHNFSVDAIHNMFDAARRWAVATSVPSLEPQPVHLFLTWNVLCGSAVHAHCQVTLSSRFPEGGVQQLFRASRDYSRATGGDFFTDIVATHEALGLTQRLRGAIAFASLTPVKEREVWLLQDGAEPATVPDDLLELASSVLNNLLRAAEAPCPAFNIAVAFPPLISCPGWEAFPVVMRIVDRGWPMLGTIDWATMEMYGTRIVSSDPFATAAMVQA